MKTLRFIITVGIILIGLSACNNSETSKADANTGKVVETALAIVFESAKDGKALPIKPTASDSLEVKEFYRTGKNPYTQQYVNNPELARSGRKVFNMYSCTQCHGGNAGGQTGPSLIDENWNFPKNVTDKGMFETISGGTNGGMPAWHQQVAGNTELLTSDEILRAIGWIRSMYIGADQTKEWLK